MIAKVSSVMKCKKIARLWKSLFVAHEPFSYCFRNSWDVLIFYPTYGYQLEQLQYEALLGAAAALGEEEFYVSETEYERNFWRKGTNWQCSLTSPYTKYAALPITVENSLLSPRGSWGVVISHEDHAIVGGTHLFLEELRSLYPDVRRDWDALLDYWRDKGNSDWLLELASHVDV